MRIQKSGPLDSVVLNPPIPCLTSTACTLLCSFMSTVSPPKCGRRLPGGSLHGHGYPAAFAPPFPTTG